MPAFVPDTQNLPTVTVAHTALSRKRNYCWLLFDVGATMQFLFMICIPVASMFHMMPVVSKRNEKDQEKAREEKGERE